MEKLSSTKVATVLRHAAETMVLLQEENSSLRNKVASYEKSGRVERLARTMEEKGLAQDTPFAEKIAALSRATEAELAIKEEAIKLSAPQMATLRLSEDDIPGAYGGNSKAETAFISGLLERD